jgi:ATP-dependent exoDNAse (exonuclease V) beta subunit
MAAGAAVHRALELLDLAGDLAAGLARQRRRLPAYLASVLDPADPAWEAARARAEDLLDRLARSSTLLARLREIAGRVAARELPVLLPPDAWPGSRERPAGGAARPPAPAAAGDAAATPPPVGFIAGAVDLLYRDPDGAWVVADFKTDRIASDEDLAARCAAYAAQGALYTRAVQEALGLPATPRFELWFLAADQVVAFSPAPLSGEGTPRLVSPSERAQTTPSPPLQLDLFGEPGRP